MLATIWKIAFRSFLKRKFFFVVVVSGLCMGLSAFILIQYYVGFENSYDTFHENEERIYRVQLERTYPDRVDLSAGVTAGVGPLIKETFPGVEAYTKLWGTRHLKNVIQAGEKSLTPQNLYFADENFFTVFSFPMEGDRTTCLEELYSVVISDDFAISMFGSKDVIGEPLLYHSPWGKANLVITGVAENTPENSHLKFDVLVSFSTLISWTESADRSFRWNAFNTYLLLQEPEGIESIRAGMGDFISTNYEHIIGEGVGVQLFFQPLREVHLGPQMRFEPEKGGSQEVLFTLTITGFLILFLAWLNYINLVTAQVSDRAREVGIRKVAGATKNQLMLQFYVEALLINLVAIVLSLTIVEISIPYFSELIGKRLDAQVYLNTDILTLSASLVLLGTLVSGTYPALHMSSFSPHTALKKLSTGGMGLTVRKGLVVFQFLVASVLISGTLVLVRQLDYMQNMALGFNASQVLVVEGPGIQDSTFATHLAHFKNELLAHPDIEAVSNTTVVPGKEISWVNNSVRWLGNPEQNSYSMPFAGVSAEYFPLMELGLLSGRHFDETSGEARHVILTESAARVLGLENAQAALGEQIVDGGEPYTVIGVTQDFHQQSLSKKIDPVIFRYVPQASSYLVLKIQTKELPATLDKVQASWNTHFEGNPYTFFFLDDFFNAQYSSDVRFARIFGIFTVLGIAIGVLGLFALSLFMIRQRTKEIGIRKVLGASVLEVIRLVSLDYVRIIGLATTIGLPAAWLASKSLLANYVHQAPLSWWIFLVPVLLIAVITAATTGYHTWQAGRMNPVDSMQDG